MKGVGYVLLLLFGAYVALRYYAVQINFQKRVENKQVAPPGVNFYSQTPVTHRPQQLWAFGLTNCCQTTQQGYSPALGPNENQLQTIASLEI